MCLARGWCKVRADAGQSGRAGMSNPLWDYSVAVYSREGISAICLELQDRYGLDVNVLLYGAWLATLNRRLTKAHLVALNAGVNEWRNTVVQPLRDLRRQLHHYPAAAAIREDLKALELRSERQQQNLMYDIHCVSPAQPAADQPLQENLALVAGVACPGKPLWSASIERLCTLIQL